MKSVLFLLIMSVLYDGLEGCVSAPLPAFSVFDESVHGVSNAPDYELKDGTSETDLRIDTTDCVTGTVKGIEYIAGETGNADINFYSVALGYVNSVTLSATKNDNEPQYICLATPIALTGDNRIGVAYDAAQTTPVIKRVYSYAPAEEYPCSQALADSNAHVINQYTGVKSAGSQADVSVVPNVQTRMRLAVRAITDDNYMYKCQCSKDEDCAATVRDCNLVCASSKCECKPGFIYNRKHNKCVTNTLTVGKPAFVKPSDTNFPANNVVDSNASGKVGQRTCAKTTSDTNPQYVVDLGREVDVHAVSLTIPVPQESIAKLFATEADRINNNVAEYLTELRNPAAGDFAGSYEKMVTEGPWPWLITTSTDVIYVINPDMNTGTQIWTAPYGTINANEVKTVNRLDYVGSFHDGTNCIVATATTVTTEPIANNNCAIWYIRCDASNNCVVSKLKNPGQNLQLTFASTLDDTEATMGSSTSTFKFKRAATEITDANLANGAFSMSLSSQTTKCVKFEGGKVVLKTEAPCVDNFQYTIAPLVQNSQSEVTFQTKTVTTGDKTFASFTDDEACIRVLEAEVAGYVITKTGGVVDIDSANLPAGTPAVTFNDGATVVATATRVGIHDFTISVGTTFDTTAEDTSAFTQCGSYTGYPVHGVKTTYSCTAPLKGRYVSIKATYATAAVSSICDINVHTATDPGLGAFCTKDEDCQCGMMDQHLYCNPASSTCECMSGYHLWEGSDRCINYDECREDANNTCWSAAVDGTTRENGTCADELGTYRCDCRVGLKWDKTGGGCIDINECDTPGDHECNQKCVNNFGSYTCECNPGYTLEADNVTCVSLCKEHEKYDTTSSTCKDINECLTLNGGCEHTCADKVFKTDGKTHECTCKTNYKLLDNGRSCEDIDECADTNLHNCDDGTTNLPNSNLEQVQGTCMNKIGAGYECICPQGYYAWSTNVCKDIDECSAAKPPCEQKCANKFPSYECSCNTGYELAIDKRSCSDIDECKLNTDGCTQECVNEAGSFRCVCNIGSKLAADMKTCEDINECAIDNGGCEHECEDTTGSFKCKCKTGYTLNVNKRSCDNVNECADTNVNKCTQLCIDTDGSYTCACDGPYTLQADGITCKIKDECADDTLNNCTQICNNVVNGHKCDCNAGYTLNADGMTCDNINECSTNNGGCEQDCADSTGSFTCSCKTGYILNVNKRTCDNVNECADKNIHKCSQICVDSVGSYKCICEGGYVLDSDGKSCTLPTNLKVNLCFKKTWTTAYQNMQSTDSRSLASEIESQLSSKMRAYGSTVHSDGNFQYRVTEFYRCGNNQVGARITAVPDKEMSPIQLAQLAADLTTAASAQPFTISGAQVGLATDPEFIHSDGTTDNKFNVKNACDYFDGTKYCQNNGECKLVNSVPRCSCPTQYTGPQCLERAGLTDAEIGLIAGLSLLFLLLLLLATCLCLMFNRRRAAARRTYVQEEYVEEPTPAVVFADKPRYAYNNGYSIYGYN